mgnify:CR=1 FL=1
MSGKRNSISWSRRAGEQRLPSWTEVVRCCGDGTATVALEWLFWTSRRSATTPQCTMSVQHSLVLFRSTEVQSGVRDIIMLMEERRSSHMSARMGNPPSRTEREASNGKFCR